MYVYTASECGGRPTGKPSDVICCTTLFRRNIARQKTVKSVTNDETANMARDITRFAIDVAKLAEIGRRDSKSSKNEQNTPSVETDGQDERSLFQLFAFIYKIPLLNYLLGGNSYRNLSDFHFFISFFLVVRFYHSRTLILSILMRSSKHSN